MNGELDRNELVEQAEEANAADAVTEESPEDIFEDGFADFEREEDSEKVEDSVFALNDSEQNSMQKTADITEEIDYDELMRADLSELKEEFPELSELESIAGLDNPLRYAALRDMGLTAREAYLASSYRISRTDNRSHLKNSVPRAAIGNSSGMSRSELLHARELFSGLSDSEIYSLYKRVSR